jgi:hypothetical protein
MHSRVLCSAPQLLLSVADAHAELVFTTGGERLNSGARIQRDDAMGRLFECVLWFLFVVEHGVGQAAGVGRHAQSRQHADGVEGRDDEEAERASERQQWLRDTGRKLPRYTNKREDANE